LNIRFMRWVDQSVGTLVCHGLAAGKKLAAPFTRQPDSYKTIAVMKFFGIGSIVVASPSLAALRELYPSAKIIFVTFKGNREILDILGLVDQVVLIDNSSMKAFARSTLTAANELRKAKVDLAIDFEFFAKYPLALASIANVPKRAGFYLTLEPWRQALLDVHGYYNHYFHTRDIFLSLVYLLATGDKYYTDFEAWQKRYHYPRVSPKEEELGRVRDVLGQHGMRRGQRLVLLNPNVAAELAPNTKRWPQERYVELARRLAEEHPDAFVAIIGSKSEMDYCSSIATAARHARVVSLAGTVSLRELIALLSVADLFVTNDSGPMHLACLVDVPIVGLFFAETPTLFGPIAKHAVAVTPALYSVPMFTVYTGKNSVDLENIPARTVSVDRVLNHVRDSLHAQTSRGESRAVH
jgi:ADP-heptose:LPS heptosyltransferase